MNASQPAASAPSTARRPQRTRSLRRALSATVAGATVALVGVGSLSPAEASAAGVAPGIRYAAGTDRVPSSVSPTDLPATSAASRRYQVDADRRLRAS